jgi:hypothetical protein
MLKVNFLAILLLGVFAAFAFGSIAAVPFDPTNNVQRGLTNDPFVVNSAAKSDRLPTGRSTIELTEAATEHTKLSSLSVEDKSVLTKPPITSWHWHAGSNKISRK